MAAFRSRLDHINSGTLARVGMDAMGLGGALEPTASKPSARHHPRCQHHRPAGHVARRVGRGGVRNILAITGDPPSLGDHPETSGVYEVDSIRLVKVLSRLNQGTDWAGKIWRRYEFHHRRRRESGRRKYRYRTVCRFEEKVAAGAHFAMTQPIFDPEHWRLVL